MRLVGSSSKAGRADQDRDRGRDRAVEARLERVGRGEIDQHVAMILVDREAGVLGDGGGDRLAHAAIGREQADADRLVGGRAWRRSWRKRGAPRNGGAPYVD